MSQTATTETPTTTIVAEIEGAPAPDDLMPVSELARHVPGRRPGRPACKATVTRWALRGVLARPGVRVRMQTWLSGGTRVSSVQAYRRFLEVLEAARDGADIESAALTPRRAERRLRTMMQAEQQAGA